jgi:uncharacterized protein YfaP (DUF2135 family)
MKNVKSVLTTLVFALAITGAVVAKTNEKKRGTSNVAYFVNSVNAFQSVTITGSPFAAKAGSNTQAGIVQTNGVSLPLYIDQDVSDPAQFVKP